MDSELKVAVISATSGFTPGLVAYTSALPSLQGGTLALYSRSAERLAPVLRVAEKLVLTQGAEVRIEGTTDRGRALEGADFVVTAIRIGGMEAHRLDIELPRELGVHQTVGDTVGPGGVFAGLRNIAGTLEIARDMASFCPKAWMLNLTNPMATICRAVQEATSVRVIGLCPGIYDLTRYLAGALGADPESVDVRIAGLNHCTWVKNLLVGGEDAYPRLRQAAAVGKLADQPISAQLMTVFGLYPSPADRHVAEFFPFYHCREAEWGRAYGLKPRDVQAMTEMRRGYWTGLDERLASAVSRERVLSDLGTEQLAGKQVADVIAGLAGSGHSVQTVNIRNDGAIAGLPDETLVEVLASLSATGAQGLCVGALPVAITASYQRFVAQQELVVKAALGGDRQAVLQALSMDALIPSIETAEALADRLLEVHAQYLTLFR